MCYSLDSLGRSIWSKHTVVKRGMHGKTEITTLSDTHSASLNADLRQLGQMGCDGTSKVDLSAVLAFSLLFKGLPSTHSLRYRDFSGSGS